MKFNLKHSQLNLNSIDKLKLPSKSFDYPQQKQVPIFRKNSQHLKTYEHNKSKQKKTSQDKIIPIRKNKSMKIVTEILNDGKPSAGGLSIGWNQIDKIQYQLIIEKRLRQSLERQNETLKKQIAFLNNFGTSIRASVNNKKNSQQEMHSTNKQKILNRLNRKRQGVLPEKDNDSTGLFSAKTKTFEEKISEMYEDYAKRRIAPILENVYEAAKNYFDQFQQNYSKLFIMFNQSKELEKSQMYRKLQDLLFLFQVPILYKKNPKQLMRSVSRERLISSKKSSLQNSFNMKNPHQHQKDKDIPEYKSSEETVQCLISNLKLILKSKKMMCLFMKSQAFGQMLKKIKQMR